ncbi:hypothetical protein VTG60DRAFT_1011 [Thermothelomyces hinnuleus]
MAPVCTIPGTPDLYGMGIRVSFYLLWFFVLIGERCHEQHAQVLRAAELVLAYAVFLGLAVAVSAGSLFAAEVYITLLLISTTVYLLVPRHTTDLMAWIRSDLGIGTRRGRFGVVRAARFLFVLIVISLNLWFWGAGVKSTSINRNLRDQGGCCPCQPPAQVGFAFGPIEMQSGGFRAMNVLLMLALLAGGVIVGAMKTGLIKNRSRSRIRVLKEVETFGGLTVACVLVAATELTIKWNKISGAVNQVTTAAQFIPPGIVIALILTFLSDLKNGSAESGNSNSGGSGTSSSSNGVGSSLPVGSSGPSSSSSGWTKPVRYSRPWAPSSPYPSVHPPVSIIASPPATFVPDVAPAPSSSAYISRPPPDFDTDHPPPDFDREHPPPDFDKEHPPPDFDKEHPPPDFDREHPAHDFGPFTPNPAFTTAIPISTRFPATTRTVFSIGKGGNKFQRDNQSATDKPHHHQRISAKKAAAKGATANVKPPCLQFGLVAPIISERYAASTVALAQFLKNHGPKDFESPDLEASSRVVGSKKNPVRSPSPDAEDLIQQLKEHYLQTATTLHKSATMRLAQAHADLSRRLTQTLVKSDAAFLESTEAHVRKLTQPLDAVRIRSQQRGRDGALRSEESTVGELVARAEEQLREFEKCMAELWAEWAVADEELKTLLKGIGSLSSSSSPSSSPMGVQGGNEGAGTVGIAGEEGEEMLRRFREAIERQIEDAEEEAVELGEEAVALMKGIEKDFRKETLPDLHTFFQSIDEP